MIKYLGSKRLLVPVLGALAEGAGARTAVDLFTGTTRVAQEFKRRGLLVTANDVATYSKLFADCWIATDAATIDQPALAAEIERLNQLPPKPGYFTRTFCEEARFFQPHNGARVDAIRAEIERAHAGTAWYPILLTSLLLAADRVDSTTGIQMAYLKQWAPRAHKALTMQPPTLLAGPGRTLRHDALAALQMLPPSDVVYLDPPYNQHRYFTNYHVWETLVRGDEPEHYGVACKRIDARDEATRSRFNSKPQIADALAEAIAAARTELLLVSYNDESWVAPEQISGWLRDAGHERVSVLGYDSKRYVGAQIGVYNAAGRRVGEASRLRNVEYIFVAGTADRVAGALAAVAEDTAGFLTG